MQQGAACSCVVFDPESGRARDTGAAAWPKLGGWGEPSRTCTSEALSITRFLAGGLGMLLLWSGDCDTLQPVHHTGHGALLRKSAAGTFGSPALLDPVQA